jgi:hypothetical protein
MIIEMPVDTDQRIEKRYGCAALIKWTYFNQSGFFNGKVSNFSQSGAYFESTRDLRPGSTIFIRVQRCLSRDSNSIHEQHLRTVTLAEVKWCREIPEADGPYFGVGIHYYINCI